MKAVLGAHDMLDINEFMQHLYNFKTIITKNFTHKKGIVMN